MSLKRAFAHVIQRKKSEGLRAAAIALVRSSDIGRAVEGDRAVVAFATSLGWVVSNHLTQAALEAAWPWAIEFSFRQDRGIWEGICKHGIGHPIGLLKKGEGIHGCDRCEQVGTRLPSESTSSHS